MVAQLVETLRYNPEGRGFDFLGFFIYIILRAALWLWGRLSLKQNISWGLKAAGALG